MLCKFQIKSFRKSADILIKMDSDKKSDGSSSDFTDSEDNLPVNHLKTVRPENSTEIVNTDDPDGERLDLKMTVETAGDTDDENETLNTKSNLLIYVFFRNFFLRISK